MSEQRYLAGQDGGKSREKGKLPRISTCRIQSGAVHTPQSAVILSDLHGREVPGLIDLLREISPPIILAVGDMLSDFGDYVRVNDPGLTFLRKAAGICPVYYTPGNHELGLFHNRRKFPRATPEGELPASAGEAIAACGVTVLKNRAVLAPGTEWAVGALWENASPEAEDRLAGEMAELGGFGLLMCHRPVDGHRMAEKKVAGLVLSGHAHGGQWRFFGQGIYAPDQGIFPRYTKGLYDSALLVCAGLSNTVPIPRLFNPTEIILLKCDPE